MEVTILVDNGSSLNFINSKVVGTLGLSMTSITPFEIKVASGEILVCKEAYKRVSLKTQGLELMVDLYSLPLVQLDVILGMQCLKELGKVVSDYKRITMEFILRNKWVALKMSG